jgi:hypothetical protein
MSLATIVMAAIGMTALVMSMMTSSATAQVRPDSSEALDAIIDREVGDARRSEIEKRLIARKPEGPVPRTAWDGKPDFNGVFYPYVPIEPASAPIESMYRPEAQAMRKRLHPEITPNMHCYPNIFTVSFTRPHPLEIFHGPGVIVAITEVFGIARVIPIVDGPPVRHSDVKPSFQGDSVGYWDGDTLVVDTTRFNGKGWLFRDRTITSDQLHIVERWTRPDSQTVEYQAVAEDVQMLTGAWTSPKMRRGKLRHDFSSFDPCLEDSHELDLAIDVLKIDPAQVKLSKDVLLHGAQKFVKGAAAKEAR